MITYDQVLNKTIKNEESHIDEKLEYAAFTLEDFLIYSKERGCWYSLVNGQVIPGRISDIIDKDGKMYLHVSGRPVTHGKWATAQNIDEFFDLFNTGNWRKYLA